MRRYLSAAASACVFGLAVGGVPSATASVPQKLHYQGLLTDTGDVAVHCPSPGSCADGDFTLTFRLYSTAEGGTAFWSEVHEQVAIDHGRIDLILGETKAIDPMLVDDPTYLVPAPKHLTERFS